MTRFAPMAAVLLLAFTAALAGQTSPPVPYTYGGPTPPTAYLPDVHGSWSFVYDWTSSFASPPQTFYDAEIGHASLIPTGSHAGKILLWNLDVPSGVPINNATVETYLLDPANPGALQQIVQTPSFVSDIFCSGTSILSDGRLLVAGGFQLSASNPAPNESYLFEPLLIDSNTAWQFPGITLDATGTALEPRYYPGLIPLTAAYGRKHLLIGGQAVLGSNPSISQLRIFDEVTNGFGAAQLVPLGGGTQTYHPETYPRGFHLSDGRIFIAGDVVGNYTGNLSITPANTTIFDVPRNSYTTAPGDTFFISLAQTTGTPTAVTVGPSLDEDFTSPSPSFPPAAVSAPPPPVLSYNDLNYGSAVLLHCLPQNGGLDRVLIFGGSDGLSPAFHAAHPGYDYPPQVLSRVQEFQNSSPVGNWHDKVSMNIPRVYLNATILPTRQILLTGGSANDPNIPGPGYGTPSTWFPVVLPEIYDPGLGATSSGTTMYGAEPQYNAVVADPLADPSETVESLFPWTPRVYHHMATLLLDGSVMVFGGNDVLPGENAFGWFLGKSSQTGEFFFPSYYHSDLRPKFISAPTSALFESSFTVEVQVAVGHEVETCVLIRTASITHHFDTNQRYIELEWVPESALNDERKIKLVAPAKDLGPHGTYMLFIITSDGSTRLPSEGRFLVL